MIHYSINPAQPTNDISNISPGVSRLARRIAANIAKLPEL